MSDFRRKIMDISRVLVSLLFLGILATSMGSSADRLIGELLDKATLLSGQSSSQATLLTALGDPSKAPENRENMTPGERSESHQTNSQMMPLIIGQDKPPSRSKAGAVERGDSGARLTVSVIQYPPLTTSAAVSSSLGKKFTLVGARPSGTS